MAKIEKFLPTIVGVTGIITMFIVLGVFLFAQEDSIKLKVFLCAFFGWMLISLISIPLYSWSLKKHPNTKEEIK